MGVGTAASAIGGHQSQQAAVNAQNEAASNNYKHQLQVREQKWFNDLNIWEQKNAEFDEGVFLDRGRVWNAYESNQEMLNQQATQAAFANETNFVKMFKAANKSGTGQDNRGTAFRDAMSAFGRDQASTAQRLTDANYAMQIKNKSAMLEQQDSLNSRYSKVSVAPVEGVAPPPPVMREGPSGLALAGKLIGAAGSTAMGVQDAMAPKGYTNRESLDIGGGGTSNYSPLGGPIGQDVDWMSSSLWNKSTF